MARLSNLKKLVLSDLDMAQNALNNRLGKVDPDTEASKYAKVEQALSECGALIEEAEECSSLLRTDNLTQKAYDFMQIPIVKSSITIYKMTAMSGAGDMSDDLMGL